MLRIWFSVEAEKRYKAMQEWRERIERRSQDMVKANDENREERRKAFTVETLVQIPIKELGAVRVAFDSGTGKFHWDTEEIAITPPPKFPDGCVEMVTLRESIQAESAFLRQGIYRHQDVEVFLTTKQRMHSGFNSCPTRERWQELLVRGPSVEAVREFYRRIRNREEEPEEPWDSEKPNKERVFTPSPEEQTTVS